MNYKLWKEHVSNEALDIENFINLPALHPCSGQLSIGDVKLHISNSITNTEGGKKVTQAVANTGRAVAGGISTAKGVFSSWMSSLKTNQGPTGQENTVSETEKSPKSAIYGNRITMIDSKVKIKIFWNFLWLMHDYISKAKIKLFFLNFLRCYSRLLCSTKPSYKMLILNFEKISATLPICTLFLPYRELCAHHFSELRGLCLMK